MLAANNSINTQTTRPLRRRNRRKLKAGSPQQDQRSFRHWQPSRFTNNWHQFLQGMDYTQVYTKLRMPFCDLCGISEHRNVILFPRSFLHPSTNQLTLLSSVDQMRSHVHFWFGSHKYLQKVYWGSALQRASSHWIFTGSNQLGLPQTPGVGQSRNTQKITKPNTQTSCYRFWAASTCCEHNTLLMKNPAKTRQPGRAHITQVCYSSASEQTKAIPPANFSRTVKVKEYDSHKYKQPASLFIWHVGNINVMYGVNAKSEAQTQDEPHATVCLWGAHHEGRKSLTNKQKKKQRVE